MCITVYFSILGSMNETVEQFCHKPDGLSIVKVIQTVLISFAGDYHFKCPTLVNYKARCSLKLFGFKTRVNPALRELTYLYRIL